MSSPLHPLGDYVVAVGEKAKTKTASGLYLPEKAQAKPKSVIVIAIGKDVKNLAVGDRFFYKEYSGDNTDIDHEVKK